MGSSIADAKKKPKKLSFFMFIAVQNNSFLDNPKGQFTSVLSGEAPVTPQPFAFANLDTFDNPLSKTMSLANPADRVGRVQGWYGNCGQSTLTLCLAQTFAYNDTVYSGTFSLLGSGVAMDPVKYAPAHHGWHRRLRLLPWSGGAEPHALESKLLSLGDSVADTIAVVCAEVLAAERALVDEEEFKATQAKLEAARTPAPLLNPPSDDTKLKGVLHVSINLYGKGNMEEDDMEQEVKYYLNFDVTFLPFIVFFPNIH
ncbi:hypothetical protein L7F22_033163 [Adiantum nelumboides]|nr:hypothetical protein [Adiantum nelumboides]